MQIDDGKGTGHSVEVNSENRLMTDSICKSKIAAVSEAHGDSFCWTGVSADLAATVNLMYLANTSTTKKLYIEKIYVWSDVATQFKIWLPSSYTAPDGTAVVGVNLNSTSGVSADATCTVNETNNALVAARVITTVRNSESATAEEGQWINYDGSVILGYQDSICVYGVADSAAFEVTIMGYFHD